MLLRHNNMFFCKLEIRSTLSANVPVADENNTSNIAKTEVHSFIVFLHCTSPFPKIFSFRYLTHLLTVNQRLLLILQWLGSSSQWFFDTALRVVHFFLVVKSNHFYHPLQSSLFIKKHFLYLTIWKPLRLIGILFFNNFLKTDL